MKRSGRAGIETAGIAQAGIEANVGLRCSRSSARRGAASVAAMVILVVVSLLMAEYVRKVTFQRRQTRTDFLKIQAEALADAAVSQGLALRQIDPSWQEGTWNLPEGTIHQTNSAAIRIMIEDGRCRVEVQYPSNSRSPITVNRSEALPTE